MFASATRDPVTITTTIGAGLLLVAAVVGIGARVLRFPYTTALVAVGVIFSATNVFGDVHLSEQVIFLGFLPPLLFEGALNVDLAELQRRRWQVAVLAAPGTLLVAGITAGALVAAGLPLRFALVVAIIVAPTDPVTVLAVCRENGVVDGLRTLLEGESLFNDAVAAALAVVAVDRAFPDGAPPSVASSALVLVGEIAVGVAVGLAIGWAAHRLMATVSDHLIEATISIAAAYGAFLIADQLHGSGVLAVILAGLLVANYSMDRAMTEASRAAVVDFWEIAAFLANSGLFLLIGLSVRLDDITEHKTAVAAGVAIIVSSIARIFSTALIAPWRDVDRRWLPAIWWGGLRGGIPIALVLGLPHARVAGVNVQAVVFAAVLWSLLVPGSTYRWLLRRTALIS